MIKNKIETLGFDKIYVLNLPDRVDRHQMVIPELELNGITEYEFFEHMVDAKNLTFKWLLDNKFIEPIQIDPGGTITIGVFGCALSHYNAWVEFLNSDHETLLILEDDIYIGDPDRNTVPILFDVIQNELKTIKDWDIFFLARLSAFRQNVGDMVTDHILKPMSSWYHPDPKPWGALPARPAGRHP